MDDGTARTDRTESVDVGSLRPSTKSLPRLPLARLVCLVGHAVGRGYRIGLTPVIVGRAPDAEIHIPAPDVSRRHARVSWRESGFAIENLNPRNGTSVNGVPIRGVHPLSVGDRIQSAASAILVVAPNDDLEQQATRLQKLEVVGQLAAGLTHDFKNALGTIDGNVDFVSEWAAQQPGSEEILQALDDIRRATSASLHLTRQILYTTHRKQAPQGVTRLSSVVDDVMSMLKHSLPRRTRVHVEVPTHLKTSADPSELH